MKRIFIYLAEYTGLFETVMLVIFNLLVNVAFNTFPKLLEAFRKGFGYTGSYEDPHYFNLRLFIAVSIGVFIAVTIIKYVIRVFSVSDVSDITEIE